MQNAGTVGKSAPLRAPRWKITEGHFSYKPWLATPSHRLWPIFPLFPQLIVFGGRYEISVWELYDVHNRKDGSFEGNVKLCSFFQKGWNVKPLPFAASCGNEKMWQGGGGGGEKEVKLAGFVIFHQATAHTKSLHCTRHMASWKTIPIWLIFHPPTHFGCICWKRISFQALLALCEVGTTLSVCLDPELEDKIPNGGKDLLIGSIIGNTLFLPQGLWIFRRRWITLWPGSSVKTNTNNQHQSSERIYFIQRWDFCTASKRLTIQYMDLTWEKIWSKSSVVKLRK